MSKTPEAGERRRQRAAVAVLAVMLLMLPLVLWGAISALRSTSNDPRQWLPRGFAETDRYDWFQQYFGSDEIAVVSWPGCTLDDPRVESLSTALAASPYFDRVRSGPSVLRQLMQPPLELSRTAALRRLNGTLVNSDSRTTCLVLSTSAVGRDDRVAAVRQIEQLAAAEINLPAEDLRLAGPTVDAAAIDVESRRLLFQLAGFSGLISLLIASLRLRSVRLAMMVLVVAGYSTGLGLAILYFSGGEMNLLMTMLPPLIYVLSISSAVHLANYYRDAVSATAAAPATGVSSATAAARARDAAAALGRAVAEGWLPCSLAALTTGIGLASLVLSKIDPIRTFGIYAAIGIVVSVAVLFLFLPAALYLFPPRRPATANGALRSPGSRFIDIIVRHHVAVLVSGLTVMGFCAWGLPYVKSTVRLQDRFLPSSDAIMDYQWLEQNVGPMVPLEVVIHFDKDDPSATLQRLRCVAQVQGKIQSLDQPLATMSAINLLPALPRGSGIADVAKRKQINSESTLQRLLATDFVAETDRQQLWRITVRAPAMGDLDYGRFAETLRQTIDPLLQQHAAEGTYTGVIPLIYKAQRQLLQDLFRSFLAAFAVIAVVLVVVLRSVSAAALAMIPNLFPAVVVFGGLEWVDIPIQIGSVMTASAALGIAVDDTVHFLTWFRRGIDQGLPRQAALRDAFQRCCGAMLHTTLICCGGLLVFAASSFVPILHFAWLMVGLLLAALVGDLLLLPAILAGPLGRGFERRRAAPEASRPQVENQHLDAVPQRLAGDGDLGPPDQATRLADGCSAKHA